MKANIFKNIKIVIKKKAEKKPAGFAQLTPQQQEKLLKKGAQHFSKKFTKVIVKLANE